MSAETYLPAWTAASTDDARWGVAALARRDGDSLTADYLEGVLEQARGTAPCVLCGHGTARVVSETRVVCWGEHQGRVVSSGSRVCAECAQDVLTLTEYTSNRRAA